MKKLHEYQLECLRRIAAGQPSVPPCSPHVLGELMEAGLVEHAPHIWLPVQLFRMTYRLTPAGEAAIRAR